MAQTPLDRTEVTVDRELLITDSTAIEFVSYDREQSFLVVEFRHGGYTVYRDVPALIFGLLACVESVGQVFNAEVKGKFETVGNPVVRYRRSLGV